MFKSKEYRNPYLEKIKRHQDHVLDNIDTLLFYLMTAESNLPQETVNKILLFLTNIIDGSKPITAYLSKELYVITYLYNNGYISDIQELLLLIGSMFVVSHDLKFDEYYDNLHVNCRAIIEHKPVRSAIRDLEKHVPNL